MSEDSTTPTATDDDDEMTPRPAGNPLAPELTGIDLLKQRHDTIVFGAAVQTMLAAAADSDQTVLAAPIPAPAEPLAWSQAADTMTGETLPWPGTEDTADEHPADNDDDAPAGFHDDGRRPLPRTLVGLLGAVAVGAVALGAFAFGAHEPTAAPTAAHRVPAAAVPQVVTPALDGLYKFTYYPARAIFHVREMTNPIDNSPFSHYYAFRSTVIDGQQVASKTLMHDDAPQTPDGTNHAGDWVAVDGAWRQAAPIIVPAPDGPAGCTENIAATTTLTPATGGGFNGTYTNVITDDGCGFIGNRTDIPVHVTRVGDAPAEAAAPPVSVPTLVAMPAVPQWPEAQVSGADEQFLADLADRGVPASAFQSGALGAVAQAHAVCDSRHDGIGTDFQADVIARGGNPYARLSGAQSRAFVALAIDAYCPS